MKLRVAVGIFLSSLTYDAIVKYTRAMHGPKLDRMITNLTTELRFGLRFD